MQTRLFPKSERGKADFGWLQANFSFSFGNYQNPEMVQFGMLRVLNDDTIAGGMGFGTHPHDNMEIISIPLEGDLEHQRQQADDKFGLAGCPPAPNGPTKTDGKTLYTHPATTGPRVVFLSLCLSDTPNPFFFHFCT